MTTPGDSQGILLPGFPSPFQAFVALTIDDPTSLRPWLRLLALTIADSKAVEARKKEWKRTSQVRPVAGPLLSAIAFTASGLGKLGLDSTLLGSVRFPLQLRARAEEIDGAVLPDDLAHPDHWLCGGSYSGTDIMLIIAGDERDQVTTRIAGLLRSAPRGIRVAHLDLGEKLVRDGSPIEHFGYADGISNASSLPGPKDPAPGTVEDVTIKRSDLPSDAESWANDGVLATFRRLDQDVAAFMRYCERAARDARGQGIEISAEEIGARLVGRWRSGTPLALSPDSDIALARDGNNAFDFQDDPEGIKTPVRAHIREESDRQNPTRPRMIRRGISFGSAYPARGPRGLLFLAFQPSLDIDLENQPRRNNALLGCSPRSWAFYGRDRSGAQRRFEHRIEERFVTPRSGLYLFFPTKQGLQNMLLERSVQ